jgi:hypothetical protein
VRAPVVDLAGRGEDADLVAHAQGELHRLGPAQHHVGVLLEQDAGEAHRVAQAGSLGHRPRPPVEGHDARVHPDHAVGLQVGAGTRVQERLVFEGHDRGFGSVRGAASRLEHPPAHVRGALAGLVARTLFLAGHVAAAAVDDQGRFAR